MGLLARLWYIPGPCKKNPGWVVEYNCYCYFSLHELFLFRYLSLLLWGFVLIGVFRCQLAMALKMGYENAPNFRLLYSDISDTCIPSKRLQPAKCGQFAPLSRCHPYPKLVQPYPYLDHRCSISFRAAEGLVNFVERHQPSSICWNKPLLTHAIPGKSQVNPSNWGILGWFEVVMVCPLPGWRTSASSWTWSSHLRWVSGAYGTPSLALKSACFQGVGFTWQR